MDKNRNTDGTFELLAGLHNASQAVMSFLQTPIYNIDDMDRRECMITFKYSGCYCVLSSKTVDPAFPGLVYIDGQATEPPVIEKPTAMFGQIIGIVARKYLTEYDREYNIRYTGAIDSDGQPIPDFTFSLRTLPRTEPGTIYPEHDELVLQAAREGAVLLKNENRTLPLGPGQVVNPFGAATVVFRLGCLGAGKINPRYGIRFKEGIEKYSSLQLNQELYQFYISEKDIYPPADIVARAKAASSTAVILITRGSSEAHDVAAEKGGYYLTDEEKELIARVTAAFDQTVAVLNVAHPIETGWIHEFSVDAVLLVGLCGMAGGRALAEILEGRVNPSGKLPATWAWDYQDYPSSRNFITAQDIRKMGIISPRFITTVYEEGLYVGYRYFDSFRQSAAYLFGHGLSYTTFEKKLKSADHSENCTVQLIVEVTNTGSRPGKEVVQIYAHYEGGQLEQPAKRLVAFAKTMELNPGASESIQLKIGPKELKSYRESDAKWIIEEGRITFFMGGAVNLAQPVHTIQNDEEIVVTQVKNRLVPPFPVQELSVSDFENTYPKGTQTKVYTQEETNGVLPFKTAPKEEAGSESPLVPFVAQMSDYELARISVGGKTGWGIEDSGFAGKLFNEGSLKKYELPDYYFADGNNGLNMFEPNIGFPVSSVICASFNEQLSYQEGLAIAREAKAMNLQCLLAPALNLQRNPLCGRNTEYFSEDPFLAGRMAGQESRGIEDAGVSSCMKHFFANNAETLRNNNHSIMSERTARELYLAAFEYAFAVNQPDTVMTGYNSANGAYCADNEELLRGVLREEWGFSGYVMSDWNGYGDEPLAVALHAGINWLAPGSMDDVLVMTIVEALQNGKLSRARLQNNVVELLRVVTDNHR